MKISIISDTHGAHKQLGILEGEILIHCGDLSASFDGTGESISDLDSWFGQQRFERILYTAGNHDFHIQKLLKESDQPFRNAIYLHDNAFTYDGIKFYGAPWTPLLSGFAFYLDEEEIRAKWAQVPPDTDVLITHTPPLGILDQPRGMAKRAGCPHLRERLKMLNPRLHCFGHVHAEYGIRKEGETTYVNAALGGEGTQAMKKPVEIILESLH